MPLIITNANFMIRYETNFITLLRAYQEAGGIIDIQNNHTEIKIYHRQYYRPQTSNFNPTFDNLGVPYSYEFQKIINLNLVPDTVLNAEKLKFVCYNTNLTSLNIYWNELTYDYTSTNSLFAMYKGSYKWLTIDQSTISVQAFLYMTLEGVNTRIINSVINVTNTIQVSTFQSYIQCDYFLPEYSGIANNFIMDNTTIISINKEGWDQFMHFQNQMNVTLTNNRFFDMAWKDQKSIMVETFNIDCPFEPYTEIVFENNTVVNPSVKRRSNVYLIIQLSQQGKTDIVIRNNRYENILYSSPGLFRITKPLLHNANVYIDNITIVNLENSDVPFAMMTVEAENVAISNIKVRDSHISRLIKIMTRQASIEGIDVRNVSRIDNPRVVETIDSLVHISSSTNVSIKELSFTDCSFGASQVLSLFQSSNVTLNGFSMQNCSANGNNLFYLYIVKDLLVANFSASGITKSTNALVTLIQIGLISPWEASHERTMKYRFENVSFTDSQVQFVQLEGIDVEKGNQNQIEIEFYEATLRNITLRGKENLVRLKSFIYEWLGFTVSKVVVERSHVDLGSIFKLEQASKQFSITGMNASGNVGNFMTISSEVSQNVLLSTISMTNNNAKEALICIQRGVQLQITGSRFVDNYSLSRGSIILAETRATIAMISTTTFTGNYAIQGGVFFVQIYALIAVKDCTFSNNFAQLGGVLYQQSEGYATFSNSTFTQNLGVHASIIYSINTQSSIEISGGEIYRNGFRYLKQEEFEGMFGEGDMKRFHANYKNALEVQVKQPIPSLTTQLYDADNDNYQLQVIKALITLKNGIKAHDQVFLLHQTSASIAVIDGLNYYDTISDKPLILTESSIIYFRDIALTNLESTTHAIRCLSDSIGYIDNIYAKNCTFALLYIIASNLSLTNFTISDSALVLNEDDNSSLLDILNSQVNISEVNISDFMMVSRLESTQVMHFVSSDIKITNLQAQKFEGQIISAESNSNLVISSSSFKDNRVSQFAPEQGIITLSNSDIQVDGCTFENLQTKSAPAIYSSSSPQLPSQSIFSINNSTFMRNQAYLSGGAVHSSDVDLIIANSTFIGNIAHGQSGGAIIASCSLSNDDICGLVIANNTFINNSASVKGGAIYYDLYTPKGLRNNTYTNNKAIYGRNFASYPFKLALIENASTPNLSQLVSGGSILSPIYVGIFDQEDQLVVIDDEESDAYLSSSDVSLQVVGNYKQVSHKGYYRFDEITFIAAPSYQTSIKLVSNALDQAKYLKVTNQEYQDFSLQLVFRECIAGEVVKNNKCSRCIKGTYSYSPFDLSCSQCFSFATCEGGNNVLVNQGYWRTDALSTTVFKCPLSSACLGGVESKCEKGYSGLLCNICGVDSEGNIYGREGASMCTKCPPLQLQVLQFLAVMLGLFAYTTYLLNSVLSNPLRNKPQTVLIRVLTNYFQVVMIVRNFDLSWPSQVEQALEVFSFITSSLELLVSFDCMMLKSGFTRSSSYSSFYYKVIAYGLAPLIISLCTACFWSLVYLCKNQRKKRKFRLVRYIQQTSLIIIYLLYPTITNLSFSLFNCVKLEDGEIYLKRDFTVKCWEGSHTYMAFYVGIPIILVWVVGFPLFIFWRLWLHRNRLNDKDVVLNYGLFYVGLDDHAFYWEIVVTNIRKVIFIICGTILSPANNTIKVLIGIVIIYTQTQWRSNFKPYLDPRFNTVEFHSQYAAIFTFFVGLFFVQEELKSNNNTLLLLFLIVLFYNIFFLVVWTRQFLNVLVRVHYKKIKNSKYCRCLRRLKIDDYDKDLKSEKRRVRQAERDKKQDQLLSGAKYVKIVGGEGRVGLKLHSVSIFKNFAEDILFHGKSMKKQNDKWSSNFVALLQGEVKPTESEQSFADSSVLRFSHSINIKNAIKTTAATHGGSSNSLIIRKLKLDEIVPDENSIAFYYNLRRQRANKKLNIKQKLEHRIELYKNLSKMIKKAFEKDESPQFLLRDRGVSQYTVEDSRFQQQTSGPLSVYEEDTEPRRVRLRNKAKMIWAEGLQKKNLKLKRFSNSRRIGLGMAAVEESDEESSEDYTPKTDRVRPEKITQRRFKSGMNPDIAVELFDQPRKKINSQRRPINNTSNPFSSQFINSNYGYSLPAPHMLCQGNQVDPVEQEIRREIIRRQSQNLLSQYLQSEEQSSEQNESHDQESERAESGLRQQEDEATKLERHISKWSKLSPTT